MITSIIPLPNFVRADNPWLFSYGECWTGDNEAYLPFNMCIRSGRNIQLDHTWKKYKLMIDTEDPKFIPECRQWEMIVLSKSDSLEDGDPLSSIYPIYAFCPASTESWVFTNSINELLSKGLIASNPAGTDSVISIYRLLEAVMGVVGPEYVDVSGIVPDFTPIGRDEPLIFIISSLAYDGDQSVQVLNEYMTHYCAFMKNVPKQVLILSAARSIGQIKPFINPYTLSTDPLRQFTLQAMSNWNVMSDYMWTGGTSKRFVDRTCDNIVPLTPEEISLTGKFLNALFKIPSNDFCFEVRTDTRMVHDFYYNRINVRDGFAQSQYLLKEWADLSFSLAYVANVMGLYPNREVYAHRSCMEDVTIYDVNDKEKQNPLLYIDLVWLIIAAANGILSGDTTSYLV